MAQNLHKTTMVGTIDILHKLTFILYNRIIENVKYAKSQYNNTGL